MHTDGTTQKLWDIDLHTGEPKAVASLVCATKEATQFSAILESYWLSQSRCILGDSLTIATSVRSNMYVDRLA